MGVMTEPRSESESSQDKQRLDDQLSSAEGLGVIKMEEMTTIEENGIEEMEEGVLDENANVSLTKEETLEEQSGEQDHLEDQHTTETPNKDDVTQENVMESLRLKTLKEEERGEEEEAVERVEGKDDPGEDGETEEVEEEEIPQEMTSEEKQALREAVKEGNIELLEDLLDKPNADINMVHFQENLLMTAIRAGQGPMAEFLLDNGVDPTFTTTLMHLKENSKTNTQRIELYEYSSRQMAYDRDMLDVVELIDVVTGRLFPGVKPREREPRIRRPPRSSSPSDDSSEDSDDDFSSTSADDSDVSGEGQSSLDGEGRWSIGDVTRSSSGIGTVDSQSLSLRKSRRRRRLASGKSEFTVEGSDTEGGLSGSLRRRLMSEEHADRDSGLHSDELGTVERESKKERRKKKKKNKENKVKDKEEETGAEVQAEEEAKADGSTKSPRSVASEAQGDQADGSKSTARTGSEHSADGATVVNDEGYETMSPSPSCSPAYRSQQMQQPPRFQAPSIPVKPTKAFLVLRRSTDNHLYRHVPAKYNEARPLRWRKVISPGSYATESPLWHQPLTTLPPTLMGAWTSSAADTTISTTTTAELTGGSRPVVDSKSYLKELNSGNTTKPKILQPSQRMQSTSSPSSAGSVEVPKYRTNTGSSDSAAAASTDKQYPLKQRVPQPNYMKMTTSSFVKRRLEPNFTNVYGSLDFVQPPAAPRTPPGARASDRSILKKSAPVPPSGRNTGVTFTSVTDLPVAASLTSSSFVSSRRKPFSGLSSQSSVDVVSYHQDVVHNIRNNSSVVPTPKLSPAPAKTR